MAKKPKRVRSLLALALIPLGSVIFLTGWILFHFGLTKFEKRMKSMLKNKRYNDVGFDVYLPDEQKVKRSV